MNIIQNFKLGQSHHSCNRQIREDKINGFKLMEIASGIQIFVLLKIKIKSVRVASCVRKSIKIVKIRKTHVKNVQVDTSVLQCQYGCRPPPPRGTLGV